MRWTIALLLGLLTIAVSAQEPIVMRHAPPQEALGLSFADATEIARGNQVVLQTLRIRECERSNVLGCGTDLPVRARKALEIFDSQANEALLRVAETIVDAAEGGLTRAFVLESTGLVFRRAPDEGMKAVRDALRKTHSQLSVHDTGSSAEGTRGLDRLIQATGAERFDPKAIAVATAKVEAREAAKPLPPAVTVAMKHASTFALQAATLLADEHYLQEVKTRPSAASTAAIRNSLMGITIEKRVLDSEVALIHVIAGELWLLARDVQKVDGKPLPESQRVLLPAVHPANTPEGIQEFRNIARQGARFNIGSIERDINVPTLALWLLTPDISPRFLFAEAGKQTINGSRCTVIRFRERAAPYLFNADGEDKPVSGRLWVDLQRSAVLRTELVLEGQGGRYRGVYQSSRALLTVDYEFNPAMAMWVPKGMTERYDSLSSEKFITGVMTYSNYRQFGTSARIVK